MNKLIKEEQIKAILEVVYQTNITAQAFNALQQMLIALPNEVKEEVVSENKEVKK